MVDKLNNVCYIWYSNQETPPAGKAGGERTRLLLVNVFEFRDVYVDRWVKPFECVVYVFCMNGTERKFINITIGVI